jgi:uncharacterized damage-inducible protein DinB
VFESETALNAFLLGYLQQSLADLEEGQLDEVPIEGLHSVRWLLTHLAIAADMGLVLLGQPKECPNAWHVAYGPKTAGISHEKIRPSLDDLIEKLRSLYPRVAQIAQSASPELLDQAHKLDLLKSTPIQTNRQLIAHLLTTHLAIHLGQLSAIRRQLGFPHLF